MTPHTDQDNRRGSVWHRWDPHIHVPGTILNDQYKGPQAWEDFLGRVENSTPPIRVLGVTDYYSTSCYQEVVKRKCANRLSGVELIFPNVEMRLGIETPKGSGINIHLLFSPDDPDHISLIERFLSELHFQFQGESYRCHAIDLIRLGKAYDKSIKEDRIALEVGSRQFKVNFTELRKIYAESAWAQNNLLVAVAGGTTDGTSSLEEDSSFSALRREIERFAHIIFSSQRQQRDFWLGKGSICLEELFEKWSGPKPCLHGSDAHSPGKVGAPDLDRYCWIKGDLTFDSLRQACLEPERAIVDAEPQTGALPSQTIAHLEVSGAPWLATKVISLNPGLIAVIGARGSGKTALADLIAAGAFSLSPHLNDSSFIQRASQYLQGASSTLTWQSGEITSARLEYLENEDLPRVQYLSQQFVEHLCSAEGLEDELLSEIERVIFQAHPIEDRMGAASFRDLLDIRLARARNARQHSQEALSQASEALTVERARKAGMDALIKRRQDKYDVIEKDKKDRQLLTSKGAHDRVRQLDQVTAAVDEARNRVEELKRRHGALLSLQDEVKHIRNTFAPAKLKELRETHAEAGLTNAQWSNFKLVFAGDVDSILDQLIKDTVTDIDKASGPAKDEVKPDPKAPPATSSYIPKGTDFTSSTLTLLEKEMNRLQRLVGIDAANAKKLTKLSEKIAKDQGALAKLDEELKLARRADERIKELIEDRKRAYGGVFSAITEEQKELVELYAPLSKNLRSQGGEIGKLAFSVRRSVDIDAWARKGEDLLDLRKIGPFKGKGTLKAIAEEELRWPWEGGTVIDVAEAMGSFRDKHERSIIEHAPFERSDREHFAAWARSISDWLYDTSHITVSYGLQYGGVDIEQLSPGTRGIVLLLL